MDTIFALATARGRAGVAVIRISGPQAFVAAGRLVGTLPQPHRAALRQVKDQDGSLIDEALVLCFPKGQSFTGDAVVELQTHGSPAVIALVLDILSRQPGLRLAEAGEFTRRALENDCLDIAQTEGLGDLIDAETEAQRRQAVRVMSGELTRKVAEWRSQIVRAMALVEATIDFADEEVPTDVYPEVLDLLRNAADSMAEEVTGSEWAERVRDGFQVAILGSPNVGKSTLINYLAGREIAITSDIAGTTRDVLTARLDVDGIPVDFLDTAGIHEAQDHIEQIGVSRALRAADEADLRIFLVASRGERPEFDLGPDDLILLAKQDSAVSGGISGDTGAGVPELLAHISCVFGRRASGVGVATKLRHRRGIESAKEHLLSAISGIDSGATEAEITAEELRSAVIAVESLVGKVDVEHILDEIFASFCIGK